MRDMSLWCYLWFETLAPSFLTFYLLPIIPSFGIDSVSYLILVSFQEFLTMFRSHRSKSLLENMQSMESNAASELDTSNNVSLVGIDAKIPGTCFTLIFRCVAYISKNTFVWTIFRKIPVCVCVCVCVCWGEKEIFQYIVMVVVVSMVLKCNESFSCWGHLMFLSLLRRLTFFFLPYGLFFFFHNSFKGGKFDSNVTTTDD